MLYFYSMMDKLSICYFVYSIWHFFVIYASCHLLLKYNSRLPPPYHTFTKCIVIHYLAKIPQILLEHLLLIWLTHCDIATPYDSIDQGKHWLRWWLGAVRHQAITWTNVDLSSVRSQGIHLRALPLLDLKIPINQSLSKIAILKSISDLPRGNELTLLVPVT